MSTWLKVATGVIFSVTATLLLLVAVSQLPGMAIPPPYWAVAVICPALVSAPVCVVLVRLAEQHRIMSLELKRANARLERLSERGSLTGLLNRGAFIDRVEALRRSAPGWFLMVDIDHFKKMNDTHGHDTGDRALQSVARAIAAVADAPALCARLGGEEFVVFHPGLTGDSAVAMANDIRSVVEAYAVPGKVRVTVSVGVAGGHDVATISDGLKAADQAMYVAKRHGRNQVRLPPRPGELHGLLRSESSLCIAQYGRMADLLYIGHLFPPGCDADTKASHTSSRGDLNIEPAATSSRQRAFLFGARYRLLNLGMVRNAITVGCNGYQTCWRQTPLQIRYFRHTEPGQ